MYIFSGFTGLILFIAIGITINKIKRSNTNSENRISRLESSLEYYKNKYESDLKNVKEIQLNKKLSEEDIKEGKWICSCGHINDSFCVRCTNCLKERNKLL